MKQTHKQNKRQKSAGGLDGNRSIFDRRPSKPREGLVEFYLKPPKKKRKLIEFKKRFIRLTKKRWLAKFLDMSVSVPSHDRFNTVKPKQFEPVRLRGFTIFFENQVCSARNSAKT